MKQPRYVLENLTADDCVVLLALVQAQLDDPKEWPGLYGLKTLKRKLLELEQEWMSEHRAIFAARNGRFGLLKKEKRNGN